MAFALVSSVLVLPGTTESSPGTQTSSTSSSNVICCITASTNTYTVVISTNTVTTITSSSFPSSTTSCVSSSEISTTSTNESATFNLETMPSNFTVGGYRFVMIYNGTGYVTTSNGSPIVNLGYSLVFNITQGSETETVVFGSGPPAPYPPSVPSPATATAFDGQVRMQWLATCDAIFFEIST